MDRLPVRAAIFGMLTSLVLAGLAEAQTPPRASVGGVASPPDAMIFYAAHGAAGACGPGCSEWLAAEGTVQWDSYKRLLAILDRQSGRKPPIIIHVWGQSNFNVAVSMGRILRDHGFDATVGTTEVEACNAKPDAECFAAKRRGESLEAKIDSKNANCDTACMLMLAGGIHRALPAGTRMILSGMVIRNRLAPAVSDERREGLTTLFGQQFRLYLREMGVDPELLDMVDKSSQSGRAIEIQPSDWIRLRIVTSPPP